MNDKELIDLNHKKLVAVYEREGLTCLSDNNYEYKGVNALAVPSSSYNDPLWNRMKNSWDIIICTQDIKYFTGQLFIHLPYVNDPVADIGPSAHGYPISYYYQNLYDRRYCMFVSCCYEKAYNYWDRIGDLIHSFFPTLLPIRGVDFTRIIDKVDASGETDTDFIALKDIKESEYKRLNEYRKDVVHYYQYESSYRYEHNSNCTNLERIHGLWNQKESFPEYFKKHLRIACEGYVHAHRFLTKVLERTK